MLKSVHPVRACCRTGNESGTRSITTKAEGSINSVPYLHPEVVCSHLWLPCQRGVQGEAVQLYNCGNAQQQLVDLNSSWSTHLSQVVLMCRQAALNIRSARLQALETSLVQSAGSHRTLCARRSVEKRQTRLQWDKNCDLVRHRAFNR